MTRPTGAELTQIKCYLGWVVDRASAATLTHNRGYSTTDYEFICQTRGSGPHSRPHKTRILDEFCATCGYHRKAALRLLNRPLPSAPPKRPGPQRRYEPVEVLPVLKTVWLASDQLCSKLLKAALAEWLAYYEPRTAPLAEAIKEKLLGISPAPIDRRLRSAEADTVAHCDDSNEGDYVNSLTFTELFSGWTENRAVWNKSGEAVLTELKQLETVVPYG